MNNILYAWELWEGDQSAKIHKNIMLELKLDKLADEGKITQWEKMYAYEALTIKQEDVGTADWKQGLKYYLFDRGEAVPAISMYSTMNGFIIFDTFQWTDKGLLDQHVEYDAEAGYLGRYSGWTSGGDWVEYPRKNQPDFAFWGKPSFVRFTSQQQTTLAYQLGIKAPSQSKLSAYYMEIYPEYSREILTGEEMVNKLLGSNTNSIISYWKSLR